VPTAEPPAVGLIGTFGTKGKKYSPDVSVPVRPTAGGGIVPVSILVARLQEVQSNQLES